MFTKIKNNIKEIQKMKLRDCLLVTHIDIIFLKSCSSFVNSFYIIDNNWLVVCNNWLLGKQSRGFLLYNKSENIFNLYLNMYLNIS